MNTIHNAKLTGHAQRLRKQMTEEECRLWYGFLKTLPIPVKRQKVIGNYMVDFYIAAAKLVIELDGSQHDAEDCAEKDRERDAFLKEQGMTVLRYSNLDIHRSFDRVCQDIWQHLNMVLK